MLLLFDIQITYILPREYVNKFKGTNASFESLISNETYFRQKFTQFLYSPKGGIFQVNLNSILNFNIEYNAIQY